MSLHSLQHIVDLFLDKTAAKSKIKYTEFDDGSIVINADSTSPETFEFVKKWLDGEKVQLIHTDPPFGRIVTDNWDQTDLDQYGFANWMKNWVKLWLPILYKGASIYIWGGVGIPKFRPFFVFCSQIEHDPDVQLIINDCIVWKKRRFFGSKTRFGFTREECVHIIYNADKPRIFNIPLTDIERGYEGFGKYKAKSKFLRRTNIWDVTEMFANKVHPTEKPPKLITIPIEASSNKNNICLDLFAGSGSTGVAARACGRRFILIEKDPVYYINIVKRLK